MPMGMFTKDSSSTTSLMAVASTHMLTMERHAKECLKMEILWTIKEQKVKRKERNFMEFYRQ